jgi:hypothetical protein
MEPVDSPNVIKIVEELHKLLDSVPISIGIPALAVFLYSHKAILSHVLEKIDEIQEQRFLDLAEKHTKRKTKDTDNILDASHYLRGPKEENGMD